MKRELFPALAIREIAQIDLRASIVAASFGLAGCAVAVLHAFGLAPHVDPLIFLASGGLLLGYLVCRWRLSQAGADYSK